MNILAWTVRHTDSLREIFLNPSVEKLWSSDIDITFFFLGWMHFSCSAVWIYRLVFHFQDFYGAEKFIGFNFILSVPLLIDGESFLVNFSPAFMTLNRKRETQKWTNKSSILRCCYTKVHWGPMKLKYRWIKWKHNILWITEPFEKEIKFMCDALCWETFSRT